MSRFRRAIVGFMVIANLGIYTAIGLWLMVDGGLAGWWTLGSVAAQAAPTETARPSQAPLPTATAQGGLVAAGAATPGWTPEAALAPLPTESQAPAEPGPVVLQPTEAPPVEAATPDAVEPAPTALPPEARVLGVVGHAQTLPLSCESRSAADWAAFFGVIVDELEFVNALPLSDDPDRGFVGDVNGDWGQLPPNDYGVHAEPVARLLRDFGMPAMAHRFMSFDTLRAELAAGRPVMVWVTGHTEAGTGVPYVASDGRRTVVAPREHTVIVVGYDAETVLIVDGANIYRRSIERFLASWGALRNMAITAVP